LIVWLAFGAVEALQLRVAAFALPVRSYVLQMLRYVLALLVLALLGRSSAMPQALGVPLQP
jgi:simple sugar transport system permease protein